MYYYYGNYRVVVLFVVTWLYLWLRAIYVPIVHDEAATFFIYIQTGKFIPWHSYPDANNHILNSFLSFLSFKIFGGSLLALRLPNLLMWPVWFFSVVAISGRIRNRLLQLIFFAGMLLAHNFFEFFGLCRGYGMSMGFLSLAFLFLLRTYEKGRDTDRIIAAVAVILALASNLTLINTGLILIFFIFFNIITAKGSAAKKIKILLLLMVIIGIPLFYLFKWMFFLKSSGLLYYHSVEGFVNAVPGTLGLLLTGFESGVIAWLMIILTAVAAGLFLMSLVKTGFRTVFNTPGMLFPLMLAGNLVAIAGGHFLLGIYYPEDRTVLYLFPLLLLSLIFLIDNQGNKTKTCLQYPVLVIFLFFPLHYLYSLNLTHSSLWHEEGIPARFYDTISRNQENTTRIPTLGGYMLRRFCWGYLNYDKGGSLPMIKTSSYPDMDADYQIVHMNKDIPWLYKYDRIDYNLSSGLSLLQRKQPLDRKEIYKARGAGNPVITDAEYFSLFEKGIDSVNTASLFVECSFQLTTGAVPFQSALIATVRDANGQTLAVESIELNWYHYRWKDNDTSFHQGLLITSLPSGPKSLSVYLVNSLREKFTIEKYQVNVYSLKERKD